MAPPRIALVAADGAMDLDTDGPLLFAALDAAGIDWKVVAWDDRSVRWREFDIVVLRACWDYFERVEEFLGVLGGISEVSTMLNPLDVVEWNLDKRYLCELEEVGLPVVETAYVGHLRPPSELAAALGRVTQWPAEEIVVKPSISAGSNDTYRLAAADTAGIVAAVEAIVGSDRVAMMQPYLAAVDTDGERGCVYVEGVFDHAFAKAALLQPGAQHHDGLFAVEHIEPADLGSEERAVADAVAGWVDERFGSLLYARVDLLPSPVGPTVVEVELIEPSLFFEADPASAERFAAAILERCRSL